MTETWKEREENWNKMIEINAIKTADFYKEHHPLFFEFYDAVTKKPAYPKGLDIIGFATCPNDKNRYTFSTSAGGVIVDKQTGGASLNFEFNAPCMNPNFTVLFQAGGYAPKIFRATYKPAKGSPNIFIPSDPQNLNPPTYKIFLTPDKNYQIIPFTLDTEVNRILYGRTNNPSNLLI